MKKIFAIAIIIIIIVGGIYFYLIKDRGEGNFFANWDNPEEVFNIDIPANFDEFKKERLGEKIAQAKELYNDKEKWQDTWTWTVMGNMYEYAGDYDRAIAAYEQVLSIQSLEVIALSNLAYIYEKYKPDYEKAEYYYKRLLESNSAVPSYHASLAGFYDNKMKDREKAEEAYLDGLQDTDNNPDLLVAIIRFYEKYYDKEKAGQYAELLINAYPDNELYKNDFFYLIKRD